MVQLLIARRRGTYAIPDALRGHVQISHCVHQKGTTSAKRKAGKHERPTYDRIRPCPDKTSHYRCYEYKRELDTYPAGEGSRAGAAYVVICGMNRLNSYDTHNRKLEAPTLFSIDPVTTRLYRTEHT